MTLKTSLMELLYIRAVVEELHSTATKKANAANLLKQIMQLKTSKLLNLILKNRIKG